MSKSKLFKFDPLKGPKFKKQKASAKASNIEKAKLTSAATIVIERPVQHVGKRLSFYRVRFTDLYGNKGWLDIPRKSFAKPSEAAGLLLDAHANLPNAKKDQTQCIEDALEHISNNDTLRLTDRLGWDDSTGDGSSFVYFTKTFGPGKSSLRLDDDSNRNNALGKRSGTLEKWRDGLEEPCRFSDHLVFGIGVAASGPLYDIASNPEPAIYHFEGARQPPGDKRIWKSSSGKSLCARAAQSMFGACARTDLFGFNMTALAVEETCFSCNNLVVILDEEGTAGEGNGAAVDPKMLPYRIIGGQGKKRSKAYSNSHGLSNRSWVVPVITTAEDELDSGKSKRKEGARVRMVSVPFPPTWQGGTFHTVKGESERNKLLDQVATTIAINHGVAMPEFLKYLVKDRATLAADILKLRDSFVKDVVPTGDNWERRYAEKFGIVLAAARLLVRYGIAPWNEERAVTAVTNLYRVSRSQTASVPESTTALLEKLSRLVAAKKRFPRVGKGEALDNNQRAKVWGVIREVDGKKNITVVKASRFRKLVQPSAVSDLVLDELDARNLLVKAPDGHPTRQLLITGLTEKRARYVCIKGLVPKKTRVKFKSK